MFNINKYMIFSGIQFFYGNNDFKISKYGIKNRNTKIWDNETHFAMLHVIFRFDIIF